MTVKFVSPLHSTALSLVCLCRDPRPDFCQVVNVPYFMPTGKPENNRDRQERRSPSDRTDRERAGTQRDQPLIIDCQPVGVKGFLWRRLLKGSNLCDKARLSHHCPLVLRVGSVEFMRFSITYDKRASNTQKQQTTKNARNCGPWLAPCDTSS